MQIIRVNGKNEIVDTYEDFIALVRENMGDDAERYLLECEDDAAAREDANRFAVHENEQIADGYLEQIREAYDIAGKLYKMILDSKFGKVDRYREEKAALLSKLNDLKGMLDY